MRKECFEAKNSVAFWNKLFVVFLFVLKFDALEKKFEMRPQLRIGNCDINLKSYMNYV